MLNVRLACLRFPSVADYIKYSIVLLLWEGGWVKFYRPGRSLIVTAWSLKRDDEAREDGRALNRIFYLNTRQALHQLQQ